MRGDLSTRRFGRWVVLAIDRTHVTRGGQRVQFWMCACDCGTKRSVRGASLSSGKSQSCGCLARELASAYNSRELGGQRFGRLVAVERVTAPGVAKCVRWRCVCDCGQSAITPSSALLSGNTKSCGCYRAGPTSRASKIVVTYNSAHYRIRRAVGSASRYACVDCSGPAMDWSYNGGDPNELYETIDGSTLAYSVDQSHYSPRCKSCHKTRDNAARRRAVA